MLSLLGLAASPAIVHSQSRTCEDARRISVSLGKFYESIDVVERRRSATIRMFAAPDLDREVVARAVLALRASVHDAETKLTVLATEWRQQNAQALQHVDALRYALEVTVSWTEQGVDYDLFVTNRLALAHRLQHSRAVQYSADVALVQLLGCGQ